MSNIFNKISHSFSGINEFDQKKYLLAVSGGVDSMVLIDLFFQMKLKIGVAHCNFKLRGKDSEEDQLSVKERCEELGIDFFTTDFDTLHYKRENKLSTQMAARELRYDWFETLKTEGNYDFVVTAHHHDDNVETVLLNLVRGTGIEGISGMKIISDFLFRPLLTLTKQELVDYAKLENVTYREDSSNASNAYKRNKIRNQVLPILKELNPSFLDTMKQNIDNFKSVNKMYEKSINEVLEGDCIEVRGSDYFIDCNKLIELDFLEQYLYEFLKDFGFNFAQVSQIITSIKETGHSGKYFYSPTHKLLINRADLVLTPNLIEEDKTLVLNNFKENVTYPVDLTFKLLSVEKVELKKESEFAFLDADLIRYPIEIRKWREGDVFQPLGMVGKKKVSDFLIDEKRSRIEKDRTYVLTSDHEIVWLIGHRINDKFKLSSTTKDVLMIKLD